MYCFFDALYQWKFPCLAHTNKSFNLGHGEGNKGTVLISEFMKSFKKNLKQSNGF